MKRSFRLGLISEQSIKDALTENKGDIFLASCSLDCTVQELDRYIKRSNELQAFASAIEQVKRNPEYEKMSSEQFENECSDLIRAFRIVGLETLHELATMNHEESAAMAKVRLEAAIALRGGANHTEKNSDNEATLQELNQLYLQNAPRIKEIRQTVVVMSDEREVHPIKIEHL